MVMIWRKNRILLLTKKTTNSVWCNPPSDPPDTNTAKLGHTKRDDNIEVTVNSKTEKVNHLIFERDDTSNHLSKQDCTIMHNFITAKNNYKIPQDYWAFLYKYLSKPEKIKWQSKFWEIQSYKILTPKKEKKK